MPRFREIRARIHGVENTSKITQAMKMVAAAKLRRAQDAIIASRPYSAKLREMIGALASNMETAVSSLMEEREIARRLVVVIASDRGLCGAFNSNLLKAAMNFIRKDCGELNAAGNLDVVTVGKRATDFLTKRGFNVIRSYNGVFNHLEYQTARRIVDDLTEGYTQGLYDRVDLIYNEFKTVVKPNIVVNQFLPIPKTEQTDKKARMVDYMFEPAREVLLNSLLPKSLCTTMWSALLDSNAAEQGSRMTAMENATKNAKDLVRSLKLQYNKARQAAITTEIIEIVSGAQALKG